MILKSWSKSNFDDYLNWFKIIFKICDLIWNFIRPNLEKKSNQICQLTINGDDDDDDLMILKHQNPMTGRKQNLAVVGQRRLHRHLRALQITILLLLFLLLLKTRYTERS